MNRRDAAETDEDGGGGDGESFSAGEVLKAGLPRMVAMALQHTRQRSKRNRGMMKRIVEI